MRVRCLSRTLTRIYDDALRPHGLSTAQLNMLVAITRAGTLRPSELGRALDLEKSTVSRNLERMLSHRWIRTAPGPDGKGYRVELQPGGRALLERALPSWAAAQHRARAHVGDALEGAVRGLASWKA